MIIVTDTRACAIRLWNFVMQYGERFFDLPKKGIFVPIRAHVHAREEGCNLGGNVPAY